MAKPIFICILACVVMFIEGRSQSSTKPPVPIFAYHPATADKPSWQRLNLFLSATYYRVVKEGAVDFNSCLQSASRSLGLSQLPVLAEGIDDAELLAQSKWIDDGDPAIAIRTLSQLRGKKHLEQL